MIVGVPKEIKDNENRVGITPRGAATLVEAGHRVLVEKGAGVGSGFSDSEYEASGVVLAPSVAEVWKADMVLKIKEPVGLELKLLRSGLLLFTYLHLANPELRDLTLALVDRKVTAIGYETVQLDDGTLPLLKAMSEVAGKMAIHVAAHYLERTHRGRGILLGGVGEIRSKVLVIGAGVTVLNAAQVALAMGANVIVLNRGEKRLRELSETLGSAYPGILTTKILNRENLAEALKNADVVVGAVLVAGARSPILVTCEMVRSMKKGSVIVDVDIDQGGIFETCRPTTHSNPVYVDEGVIHYCVTNMPGAVPRTSTIALTNTTLPYALKLANLGFAEAVKGDRSLEMGVNTYAGYVTNQGVAEAHSLEYKPLKNLLP